MAKKDFHWLAPGVVGLVGGGVDQALVDQSKLGHTGAMKPAQVQGAFAGLLTIGGGVGRLFTKRPGFWQRMAEGAFVGGATLLGQSAIHQVDRVYVFNTPATTPTTPATTQQDPTTTATATVSGSGSTGSGSTSTASATVNYQYPSVDYGGTTG